VRQRWQGHAQAPPRLVADRSLNGSQASLLGPPGSPRRASRACRFNDWMRFWTILRRWWPSMSWHSAATRSRTPPTMPNRNWATP